VAVLRQDFDKKEYKKMSAIIRLKEIVKTYGLGNVSVLALRGIDLEIEKGEFVAIMGSSGSGKSTLMNILGCLDMPTSGEFYLDNKNVSSLEKNEYANIRNQKIGFVFQGFNLLAKTSALENVELPLSYDRDQRIKNSHQAAIDAMNRVGLGDRLDHEPNQLSGGQQQRVAIARALVNKPAIILADEPTGNLDSVTSIDVMTIFQELNKQGITIIIVTHESDIARYAKRIVKMHDGKIVMDKAVENRKSACDDLKLTKAADVDNMQAVI